MVYQKDESIRQSILSALGYFNIFKFPLYFEEVLKYVGAPVSADILQEELNALVAAECIFLHKNLYMLENNETLAENRIKSSAKAAVRLKEAQRSGKIIARFPFVRSVCVSGSLSKGYADDLSDIDFFIITGKNRLWICRSLLHIFKKFTFLNNKQHSYCMNYFLDESMLCLEEQNNFTGTEIITLIPVHDEGIYFDFIYSNLNWVSHYFPNFILQQSTPATRKNAAKHIAEFVFNLLFAGAVNKGLMLITDKWWRFKWQRKNYPMEDYDLAMKTKWYVSKNHPANYQKKILQKLKLQVQ